MISRPTKAAFFYAFDLVEKKYSSTAWRSGNTAKGHPF
jgi:hypothetical protein